MAVAEGWVRMSRLPGAPAISRNVPRLELVDSADMLAVPLTRRLPLASGVPTVGWTRTFCQVRRHLTPAELELVTVKTIYVAVREVMAAAVPLATPLMLTMFLPLPASRVIKTVGAVPPVSNMNPAGALRMMVPVPTLPLAFSE